MMFSGNSAEETKSMNDSSSGMETLEIEPTNDKRRPVPYVYMLASMAALNSANLGYDIGVMGGAKSFIQENWHLSDAQIAFLVGILNFCAIGGAATAQYVIDAWGRRATFQASCCVFITGVMGMACSVNYAMLLLFRMLTGIGVGIGFSVDPVYIAEVAPKGIRGELVTWSEISINIGILTGFMTSWGLKDYPAWLSWRLMLGCGAIAPVVLFFCVFFFMPESPRWLVAQGRQDDARQVLHRVTWPDEDRTGLLREMAEAVKREQEYSKQGWSVIWNPATPGIRRALFVGIGVAGAQQGLAEESLLFYLPEILQEMNVDRVHVFLALVAMGTLKTLCIVIAAQFLDNCGRKPMLLLSVGGMGGALLGLSLSFFFRTAWGAISMIWSYMAFFSLGIGPVTWLLASEVFPLSLRGKAMALATTNNRLVSTLIAISFPNWVKAAGAVSYFATFAGLAVVVWTIIFLYVPETKGRSLEAMAAHFERVTSSGGAQTAVPKKDAIDAVLETTTESPMVSIRSDVNAV